MIALSKATTTPTNTHIVDSCTVTGKDDMRRFLAQLREERADDMAVSRRDLESQVHEWRAHNFFYKLHVFRSRTKDVDLELKQSWWREWFCRVVSFLYFWD